ncbi:hypothetical protein [Marinicrinis sediminis]|uniref:Phage tail tape measure protein n=1 Tax=Marinicrinis sediminis TaxID=1652465 RepID=A0ABW5R7M9_9BACL
MDNMDSTMKSFQKALQEMEKQSQAVFKAIHKNFHESFKKINTTTEKSLKHTYRTFSHYLNKIENAAQKSMKQVEKQFQGLNAADTGVTALSQLKAEFTSLRSSAAAFVQTAKEMKNEAKSSLAVFKENYLVYQQSYYMLTYMKYNMARFSQFVMQNLVRFIQTNKVIRAMKNIFDTISQKMTNIMQKVKRMVIGFLENSKAVQILRKSLATISNKMSQLIQTGKKVSSFLIKSFHRISRAAIPVFHQIGRTAGAAFRLATQSASKLFNKIKSLQRNGSLTLPAYLNATNVFKKLNDIKQAAFQVTIGSAANQEVKKNSIEAAVGDKQKAEQYFQFLDDRAKDSMADMGGYLDASQTLMSITTDTSQLQKLMPLVERLYAYDPAQGMDGAVNQLKQIFSGNMSSVPMAVSMNMDGDFLENLRSMDLTDQLDVLDGKFNELGLTSELWHKQNQSGMGMFQRATNKVKQSFTEVGQAALDKMKPAMEQVVALLSSPAMTSFKNLLIEAVSAVAGKFNEFVAWLTENQPLINTIILSFQEHLAMLQPVLDGIIGVVKSVGEFILNNWSVLAPIIYGIVAALTAWSIIQAILNSLAMVGTLGIVAAVGTLIGAIVLLVENWDIVKEKMLSVFEVIVNGMISFVNIIIESFNKLIKGITDNLKFTLPDFLGGYQFKLDIPPIPTIDPVDFNGSHSAGLSYVPFNGYAAKLHKGERVLTAEQNRQYNQQANAVTVAKLADQIIVREEADIDRIARSLAAKIREAGFSYA